MISHGKLAVILSPVETAMGVILDRDSYSIQLGVSIVWAAVFDLLALFLGIIRYYILRPNYSILSGICDHDVRDFYYPPRLCTQGRAAKVPAGSAEAKPRYTVEFLRDAVICHLCDGWQPVLGGKRPGCVGAPAETDQPYRAFETGG